MDASLSTEPCWVKLVSSGQVEFGKMSAEAEYRQPTEPQRLDSSNNEKLKRQSLFLSRAGNSIKQTSSVPTMLAQ